MDNTCVIVYYVVYFGVCLFLWLILPCILKCFGLLWTGPGYNIFATEWPWKFNSGQNESDSTILSKPFACLKLLALMFIIPIYLLWLMFPGLLFGLASGIGAFYACEAICQKNSLPCNTNRTLAENGEVITIVIGILIVVYILLGVGYHASKRYGRIKI